MDILLIIITCLIHLLTNSILEAPSSSLEEPLANRIVPTTKKKFKKEKTYIICNIQMSTTSLNEKK
jgi:hypothetical protein